MVVKKLAKEEFGLWDAFILNSPQNSLYVKTWYLNALNVSYDIVVVMNKNKISGGIILTKDDLKLYGNPFLLVKYLGICFDNFEGATYTVETNKRKVLKELVPYLNKYYSFDYKFHPTFKDNLIFFWNGYEQTNNYTYILNLVNQSTENILAQMNARLRSKINKAIAGKELHIDFDVAFDNFYDINEKTFLRQGGKMPVSRTKLGALVRTLKEKQAITLLGVRNNEGQLLSVLGLFYDENTAYLTFNGFDPDNIVAGANELLVFNAIQFSLEKNLKVFDFEGSMLQPIESFYRQFGGELTPYFSIWKSSIIHGGKKMLIKTYKRLKYNKS